MKTNVVVLVPVLAFVSFVLWPATAHAQVVPVCTLERELLPADPADFDRFGVSLDLEAGTLAVGAAQFAGGPGKAYVFLRAAGGFTQHQKLVCPDSHGSDLFGMSAAISGDSIVVGAPGHLEGSLRTGAAYVFVKAGPQWTLQAKLLASDGAHFDNFGQALDIDGDTVVIGANGDDGFAGSVYVFTRSGVTWTQAVKLLATPTIPALFGSTVALSGDTLAVGSFAASQARVAILRGGGATWVPEAEVMGSPAINEYFGISIALDGDTLLVGARGYQAKGAAYVFVRSGSAWFQQALLLDPTPTPAGDFAQSVHLHGDSALCSSHYDDDVGDRAGSAYRFVRSGSTWSPVAQYLPVEGPAAHEFGMDLAQDDQSVAVAEHSGNGGLPGLTENGSVYTYALPEQPIATPYCFGDGSGTPCPCGNLSPAGQNLGCVNRTGSGEALFVAGSTVANGDLNFVMSSFEPHRLSVLFIGSEPAAAGAGIAFGNGLQCVGGQISRLQTAFTNPQGYGFYAPIVPLRHNWTPGRTWYFQVMYRDPPPSPCGLRINTTNALRVTLTP